MALDFTLIFMGAVETAALLMHLPIVPVSVPLSIGSSTYCLTAAAPIFAGVRGFAKRARYFRLSVRYTARGTQQPVPEGTTHIPRVRALIRSRMYGFAKSHPEGLATRTKLRLLSERPSQAQGPQSSARRRSTRNPLPSSDKSAGRILKCPKDGALSSSPASPPSPACTRHDVPHRGRVYPGCCGLTAASPTSCSPNQDAGHDHS